MLCSTQIQQIYFFPISILNQSEVFNSYVSARWIACKSSTLWIFDALGIRLGGHSKRDPVSFGVPVQDVLRMFLLFIIWKYNCPWRTELPKSFNTQKFHKRIADIRITESFCEIFAAKKYTLEDIQGHFFAYLLTPIQNDKFETNCKEDSICAERTD